MNSRNKTTPVGSGRYVNIAPTARRPPLAARRPAGLTARSSALRPSRPPPDVPEWHGHLPPSPAWDRRLRRPRCCGARQSAPACHALGPPPHLREHRDLQPLGCLAYQQGTLCHTASLSAWYIAFAARLKRDGVASRLESHHMYSKVLRCTLLARTKRTESRTIRPHFQDLYRIYTTSHASPALQASCGREVTTIHACRRHTHTNEDNGAPYGAASPRDPKTPRPSPTRATAHFQPIQLIIQSC